MRLNLLDQIGDWNPQLFRELKGRLKSRNVLIAIGLSLVAQFVLLNFFNNQLPSVGKTYNASTYCLKYSPTTYDCIKQNGIYLIDWQHWWRDILISLNWGLLFVVMLSGVYMLINDLDQEERRGTLNFIRLSPQRSRNLLIGKLLGVPVLLYLAVGAIVPLHLFAGMQANAPIAFILSYYVMLLAGCYFLFSTALLGGFLGKLQGGIAGIQITTGTAFLGVFLTAVVFVPNYIFWNLFTVWNSFHEYVVGSISSGADSLQWFYIPLGQSLLVSHGFTLLSLGIGSYWVWQALDRCFHSPGATLLSKRQSYGLVISCQVLMLGFLMQDWVYDHGYYPEMLFGQVALVSSANLALFLVLIAMLSAHRQTLLDWARYRHFEMNLTQTATGKAAGHERRRSPWQDLVWGERSPAVVAIAINLLITAVILVPWIIFHPSGGNKWIVLMGLVISINLVAIYASIAQLVLMMKNQRRGWWAMGAVGLAVGLPLLSGVILYAEFRSGMSTALLLFSPLHWVALSQDVPGFMSLMAILGQWGAIALLNTQLARNLKQVGQSASKPLLTGAR